MRIATGPANRLMNLPDEAGRRAAYRADSAAMRAHAAAVADLAGTDAEMVVIVCHATMIGSRNAPGKSRNAIVVE
jgi:putative hemolysin